MSGPLLVLLPGLGADARLFEPQRVDFPELLCPPWPEPNRNESLASFARRIAADIPRDRPLVLGGASMGGMLASEMASLLKPAALVLIGSCTAPSAIARPVRWVGACGGFVPSAIAELSRPMTPLLLRALGPMRGEDRALLAQMAQGASFAFMRWAGRATLAWEGAAEPGCRVVRIHGDRDRIVPLSDPERCEVIRGAGHVPNLSHAGEVNTVLRRVMNECEAEQDD